MREPFVDTRAAGERCALTSSRRRCYGHAEGRPGGLRSAACPTADRGCGAGIVPFPDAVLPVAVGQGGHGVGQGRPAGLSRSVTRPPSEADRA
jgi:hypothetical protein